jgi:hypothetical protein
LFDTRLRLIGSDILRDRRHVAFRLDGRSQYGRYGMTEFFVGDKVRVTMPRGYSKRGVLGISVLYTTSPEAKFEGALGVITKINPQGLHSVHQYLVDFRPYDNSRIGIPWQAQWFREEWLSLEERNSTQPASAPQTAPRAGAEDSVSPIAAGTSPGGDDRTPAQDEQERRRLASSGG